MKENSSPATLFYPNKMGRVFLRALQNVLVGDGYPDLLKRTGLSHFEQTLPPDNWAKEFGFNIISSLNQGVEQYYGPRGGRRLALEAGRIFFELGWGEFGTLAGLSNVVMQGKSLPDKLKTGLLSISRLITEVSDQVTWVEERAQRFDYHVGACPVCWNRVSEEPICFHTVGYLQGALHWLSAGLDFRVRQASCIAMGDEQCIFRIDRGPIK